MKSYFYFLYLKMDWTKSITLNIYIILGGKKKKKATLAMGLSLSVLRLVFFLFVCLPAFLIPGSNFSRDRLL